MLLWTLGLLPAWAQGLPTLERPLLTGEHAEHDSAVVISVEDYTFLPDIPGAGADASLVRELLIYTRGIAPSRVRMVEATSSQQAIREALDASGAATGPDGTVWVYFTGHGYTNDAGDPLLLGQEANPQGRIETAGIPVSEVVTRAASGGAQVMVMMDTSFNGTTRDGTWLGPQKPPVTVGAGPTPDARTLFWYAATSDNINRQLAETRQGAFTYLLVGALRGWADGAVDARRDGTVTAAEADAFLKDRLNMQVLRAQEPSGWVLTRHAEEARPDLSGLALLEPTAQPATEAPPVNTTDNRGLFGITKPSNAPVIDPTNRLKSTASREFLLIQGMVDAGNAEAAAALHSFIERYQGASIEVNGQPQAVEIPEVATARALLESFVSIPSASCDTLRLDPVQGLINGVSPTADPDELQRAFPCSSPTELGWLIAVREGFLLDPDSDLVAVISDFTGTVENGLLGASRSDVEATLGKASGKWRGWTIYPTSYGCARLGYEHGVVTQIVLDHGVCGE